MSNEYNVIGVGFGPSNIALAVALQEKYPESNFVFLEKRARVDWQPNMLLSGSDIQNNPLRDFVTPRNPKSHYGFINYLKEQNRLFDFLNLPLHYPLRSEYAGYVRWVASHFENNVILNAEVESVTYDRTSSEYPWVISSKEGTTYRTKNLIWGTGREPNIPEVYKHALGDSVFHLNDFESEITIGEDETETIAVLGASQSAVEIILDLANRYPDKKLFLFREALVSASKTQVHLVIMFIFRILSLTTMLLNQKKERVLIDSCVGSIIVLRMRTL